MLKTLKRKKFLLIKSKLESIKYAREKNIPFFGICLGMQLAVVDIDRNVLKIKDADSTEFNDTKNLFNCCPQINYY